MHLLRNIFVGLIAVSISGCVAVPAVVVGAGATAGYMAAQERGIKDTANDTKIKTHIKDRLTNVNYTYLTEVGVSVLQGDVLLTGVIKTQEAADEIVRRTTTIPGVGRIYNELMVGEYGSQEFAKDSWVSTQLRARFLGSKEIFTINYMVDVINGHVYIMGIATTPDEMERVLYVASTTKGVKQVHNYVRLANESGQ